MQDRTLAVVSMIFFASELTLALTRRARYTGGATREDGGSGPVLWVLISSAVIGAFAISGIPSWRLPVSAVVIRRVALALMLSGLAIRWWAVLTLGRFFTVDVATHRDHTLVDSGPFRFVRHPSYTGLLLAFLGMGVSLGSTASLVILMTPILVALSFRIRVEEAALRRALGARYDEYCARTKRIIPGIV